MLKYIRFHFFHFHLPALELQILLATTISFFQLSFGQRRLAILLHVWMSVLALVRETLQYAYSSSSPTHYMCLPLNNVTLNLLVHTAFLQASRLLTGVGKSPYNVIVDYSNFVRRTSLFSLWPLCLFTHCRPNGIRYKSNRSLECFTPLLYLMSKVNTQKKLFFPVAANRCKI